MSELKKTKIAIMPHFEFEAAVATFFDKEKFEIVPIDITAKGLTDKFGQDIYGDWCCPLKLIIAAFEKAVVEQDVKKIIGVNINVCSYPMLLGNLEQWIEKDFEYYPIQIDAGVFPVGGIKNAFQQLKKAIPDFAHLSALYNLFPVASQRYKMAAKVLKFYYEHIPLVRNPKVFKREFAQCKYDFINAKDIAESEDIFKKFKETTKKQVIHKKATNNFLIAGDIAVLTMDFPVCELDLFLAKNKCAMIKTYASYGLLKYSKHARKAKEIISEIFSNKNNKTYVSENHSLETSILFRILKGIDEDNVDGIIYLKPNMCAPCDHLSYILKKNNYFGLPVVEISYDEHSGANGVETRLEAFINIVNEGKEKKKLEDVEEEVVEKELVTS